MAKKSKRQMSRSTVSMSTQQRAAEFKPDYTYVKRDLSRIGMLAGSFFALLIVLSFFLR